MSFEDCVKSVANALNPVDFGLATFDSAVQKPWNAIAQLSDGVLPSMHVVSDNDSSLAAKAGNLAGFVLDFTVLSKFTGAALDPVLGKAADGVLGSTIKMGAAGTLYGGVLTPSDPTKGLLAGRLESAATSGLTFAVMGGVGKALTGAGRFTASSLRTKVLGNAVAGGAGGAVNDLSTDYFDNKTPTFGNVAGTSLAYAAFGGLFGVADEGLGRVSDSVNVKLGRGIGIDRYISSNKALSLDVQQSPTLQDLLANTGRIRVQPGSVDSAEAGKNLVHLNDAGSDHVTVAKSLAHELSHVEGQNAAAGDPYLASAAADLSENPDNAWSTFREARLNGEVKARLTENRVGTELGASQNALDVDNLRASIPGQEAQPGLTYEQLWRNQFDRFANSGGQELPMLDYKGDDPKTAVQLLEKNGHSDYAQAIENEPRLKGLKVEGGLIYGNDATVALLPKQAGLPDGGALKILNYDGGWNDEWGKRPFDAKILYGPVDLETDGSSTPVAIIQERADMSQNYPDDLWAEFQDKLPQGYSFEPGMGGAPQIGLSLRSGELVLVDYDAIGPRGSHEVINAIAGGTSYADEQADLEAKGELDPEPEPTTAYGSIEDPGLGRQQEDFLAKLTPTQRAMAKELISDPKVSKQDAAISGAIELATSDPDTPFETHLKQAMSQFDALKAQVKKAGLLGR